MRVTTSLSYEQSIVNLQKRQQELSNSQVQLTSGKRVNKASDDPTAAARAERALTSIARTEANQRAIDASRNVMNIAESAMADSIDLMQSARETLVAIGNGSYTDSERSALANKLAEIRKQLLNVANRPDGGGGYVFGGQGSSSPPFVDTPTGVEFQGQSGEIMASSGEALTLTVDGRKAWLQAKSGNGVFTTASDSGNSGSAWVTSGAVTNPSQLPYPSSAATPPSYSVVFTVSGSTTTYDVLDDSGTALVSGQPYKAGKAIDIPGLGMSVTISGGPGNGDKFTVGQSEPDLSIFDSLDKAISTLKTAGINNGQVMQAVNTGVTELDSILGNMQGSRSAVGETLNRMDGIESRNSALKLAAKTEKSNAEDLDMTEAISEFTNRQSGYQAALQSYASIQKLSLFQYIG